MGATGHCWAWMFNSEIYIYIFSRYRHIYLDIKVRFQICRDLWGMNRKDYGNGLSLSQKEKMTAMLSISVIHFYISNPQNLAQNNLLFFMILHSGLGSAEQFFCSVWCLLGLKWTRWLHHSSISCLWTTSMPRGWPGVKNCEGYEIDPACRLVTVS